MKTICFLKKIYLFAFVILACHQLMSQKSMNDYLIAAANNNPGLKTKFSEYMAALKLLPQAGQLPDPQIAFDYFIQSPDMGMGQQRWSITLMQHFPWFGLLKTQQDIATMVARTRYEEFLTEKSKLFYEVKETCYQIYFLQQSIDIAKENIRILETIRSYTLIKIEAGQTTLADELRIEIEINDLNYQILLLQDKLQDLMVKLKNLTGVENPILPGIQDTITIAELPRSFLDSILTNSPIVKLIERKIETYLLETKAAYQSSLPSFSAGAGYTYIKPSSNPMADASNNGKDMIMFPMITVTIPLYRQKYKAMIEEAQIKYDGSKNQLQQTGYDLENLFEKTGTEFKDAQRRKLLYTTQGALAEKTINILMESYANDNNNFDEILRMEKLLLQYRLEKEKAIVDKLTAMAFLQYLLGN